MSDLLLTVEDVAAFLRANPGFFEQHVDVLLDLSVAHPHGGRTVSIPERQLIATREKVRAVEGKLAELIRFGEENDVTSEKVHALTLKLIDASHFNQAIDCLYLDLFERFHVPHVTVRLWDATFNAADGIPELQPVPAEVRAFVEAMTAPYCGNHPVYETHLWFGEHAPHLKSWAMVPLRNGRCFGVLLMASESAERFYADMGTIFLTRIGEVFAHAIARQLTFAAASA